MKTKITYEQLKAQIERLRKDVKNASTKAEQNYFEMELLVAEEYLERMLMRGRR